MYLRGKKKGTKKEKKEDNDILCLTSSESVCFSNVLVAFYRTFKKTFSELFIN